MRGRIRKLLQEFSGRKKYNSLMDAEVDYGVDKWMEELINGNFYGDAFDHLVENFTSHDSDTDFVDFSTMFSRLSVDDLQNDENLDEFYRFLVSTYDELVERTKEPNVRGGKVTLYRALTVDWKQWIQNLLRGRRPHLGVYWAAIEEAAEAHWGKGGMPEIVLTGQVPVDGIDWLTSLKLQVHPDLWKESEIRLFDNVPIQILEIETEQGFASVKMKEEVWNQITSRTFFA